MDVGTGGDPPALIRQCCGIPAKRRMGFQLSPQELRVSGSIGGPVRSQFSSQSIQGGNDFSPEFLLGGVIGSTGQVRHQEKQQEYGDPKGHFGEMTLGRTAMTSRRPTLSRGRG